jgi:hypothetical protein
MCGNEQFSKNVNEPQYSGGAAHEKSATTRLGAALLAR